VNACALSPDERFMISASESEDLQVLDFASGRLLYTLENPAHWVNACAFSPDGRYIFSANDEKKLQVWNSGNGEMLACFPFPAHIISLGLHPALPQMVCGDFIGTLYRLEVMGLEYGPIIATATRNEKELAVRCPACQYQFQIGENHLDREIICPNQYQLVAYPYHRGLIGCNTLLKLNPFVIHVV